ncbi:HAD-IA family hydrolase [Clostridium manihotivorum]|uniref:Phosphoglycolate phosphatase n=1 Tax=Clostridium manihotivorum TaxID=2320868 RepID=A0A3R5X203_9CLOT|nr:HAD-IA family hydrolase [Clostridium manihotivorum]QAA32475.1 phosphoglycolate phosphatase [Clostridium manihotivorum]
MYKHIIWDFDGTLFDTYTVMATTFKETLEAHGFEAPIEEILKYMKVSMSTAAQYYSQKFGIDDDFLSEYSRRRKDAEEENCKPYAGIEEVCRYIHSSGKNNYLYTHRGESSIRFLKKYGLYDYFTDFITKGSGFERKPSPEAIEYLIKKHNILKHEAIMIGDRELDILSGKNAGIYGCYFNEAGINIEVADHIVSDFSQLYSIID